MDEPYFVVINGKPEGPYNLSQIKAMGIKPGDFLKTRLMDDYKEAHEIYEIRALMGFGKQAFIPQYFGSFEQRLLAAALDWFFVAGACIVIVFLISLFMEDKETRLVVAFSLFALIPFVKFIYQALMDCGANQGSYGKQILKIRVGNLQGERITLKHSIGRNFAKLLSAGTFFIGYLFCFFNKKQQCLHDIVAGTLVVKDRLF